MNDYREVRIDISPCNEDGTDYMAALLADVGFESFVPDASGLTAYIKTEDYDVIKLNNALAEYPFAAALDVSSKVIEGRDWNAEWEKNYFQPIVIGDQVVIHSTFHKDVPAAKFDIVIDPKMAFGTGHHATTSQVMQALLSTDLNDKTVIDMGTGTGILSILAVMAGATSATGIEIDAFAFNNGCENIQLNNTAGKISLINGDASALADLKEADIFVANINRNVITNDIHLYVTRLKAKGTMILSGFYESDIPVIMEVAEPL
ncbi:MAG: 50S ribosomal protein L11 methyltransferase, partial [Muribaculaceae bacterium]|nr:50S ribosomal protein L11 methyltransferase [Muribaculaceae bacterium]